MTRRRWIGRSFVGGLLLLVAAAVWIPDLRYARELSAARREGLWTTADDVKRAVGKVSKAENAAPLIQIAVSSDRKDPAWSRHWPAIQAVAEGHATAKERGEAQAALDQNPASLARWREISGKSKIDYGHRYEDGYRVLFPELAPMANAIRRLVVAARLGNSPHENLLAAARLSALARQEPGIVPASLGTELGQVVLKAAQDLHLARAVEPAFGPVPDMRRVLGPELPAFLDTADYRPYVEGLRDLGLRGDIGWTEAIFHRAPFVRNTKAVGIATWRTIWARLPQDATDFDGAAKALDEELPKLDRLMPSYAEVMTRLLSSGSDPGRGAFLREIGAFEQARAKVRAGK